MTHVRLLLITALILLVVGALSIITQPDAAPDTSDDAPLVK